eukprot:1501431-Rhodomonas_salina.1
MIRDCRGKGIFVHEKGLGTFDGNDVHHPPDPPTQPSSRFQHCVCTSALPHAGLRPAARFLLRHVRDSRAAVAAAHGMPCPARNSARCRIRACSGPSSAPDSTRSRTDTEERVDYRQVVGNSSTGVTVATGGDPTLRRNKVRPTTSRRSSHADARARSMQHGLLSRPVCGDAVWIETEPEGSAIEVDGTRADGERGWEGDGQQGSRRVRGQGPGPV